MEWAAELGEWVCRVLGGVETAAAIVLFLIEWREFLFWVAGGGDDADDDQSDGDREG